MEYKIHENEHWLVFDVFRVTAMIGRDLSLSKIAIRTKLGF
jgi:hypothetical protein